jgi:hypothetical protein
MTIEFEDWWKENFEIPKTPDQSMVKSVAYHAWTAGRSHIEAEHTKEVMLHAVTKFELAKLKQTPQPLKRPGIKLHPQSTR